MAVLVLGDQLEALDPPGKDLVSLHEVGEEPLPRQRERALDDQVVQRHEVDLRLDVARVLDQALPPLDEYHVEHLDEGRVEVVPRALQAILEGPIETEHLLVEAVEVLRVAGLIDLLGGQERLFALALVGHHQARELGRDTLLADEERRQVPRQPRAQLGVHPLPVAHVLREVDRVGLPVLALPQLVQLLGGHERHRRQLRLVGDRPDISLACQIQQRRHALSFSSAIV